MCSASITYPMSARRLPADKPTEIDTLLRSIDYADAPMGLASYAAYRRRRAI